MKRILYLGIICFGILFLLCGKCNEKGEILGKVDLASFVDGCGEEVLFSGKHVHDLAALARGDDGELLLVGLDPDPAAEVELLVAPGLGLQPVELLVELHDLELRLQVHLVVELGPHAVLRVLPVLAHHDHRGLQGCNA